MSLSKWSEMPERDGTMLIPVTKTEVQAAQLRIKIDRKRGVQTPRAIRELADARPATDREAAELRAAGAAG